jgi:hypothetical protein
MTQITIHIQDSKVPFFMELIKNFDFVKVDNHPTKEEIKKNIKQGLKELQLVEQGKLKTRPAKDFLNEL